MLQISASNGGDFVPDEEVAEALGMFQIQHSGYFTDKGVISELVRDETWTYTYKSNVWRIHLVYGPVPNARDVVPIRLHFDYLRQQE